MKTGLMQRYEMQGGESASVLMEQWAGLAEAHLATYPKGAAVTFTITLDASNE